MGSVADARLALALSFALGVGCAEDDLTGSLSNGECSPGGKCAPGYECNALNECVPSSDAGDAGPPDVESDAPCAQCPSGFICCADSCVDKNEPAHCGSCSNVCPGTVCQAGTCINDCQPGLADCNKNAIDGCEAPATSCPGDAGSD